MRFGKRGLSSWVFLSAMGLLIIGIIVLFAVQWGGKLESKQKEAQYIVLDEKIRAEMETLMYGQVKKTIFKPVPKGTRVCLIPDVHIS